MAKLEAKKAIKGYNSINAEYLSRKLAPEQIHIDIAYLLMELVGYESPYDWNDFIVLLLIVFEMSDNK